MRAAMKESTILLAAHRAMLDAVIDTFVPRGQRQNARAAATAIGVGYEPKVEAVRKAGRAMRAGKDWVRDGF